MGYIILETEVEYYRCSVLYGTQMNTIHNSAGQNRFIGTDMFSDRNTVESVLNEIKIEIMQRGFSNIDGIILIHPCNISARSYALLYTSCKNCFGFSFVAYNPLFQIPFTHIILIWRCVSMITEDLGKRIRELRQKTGLSQEKFALKIGMDRTYFASVEAGKRNIAICNIKKIADGLGVTLSELFDFEELQ